MSVTVREGILENIKTALEAITTANGYANTLGSVERFKQRLNALALIPAVVIVDGPEQKEYGPNPLTTCTLSVYIDVYTRLEESDTQAAGTVLNSLLGDIEKALVADVTRGGSAIDTRLAVVTPFPPVEGGAEIGMFIEVEVQYRHYQTDPYTAG